MTTFELVLTGCAPVPLGSYLKALGIFRLLAEQADHTARGFWRDERFVIQTFLGETELTAFFVDNYQPSPIISPWNRGSGFYFQERKSKDVDRNTGKRLKTGTWDEATRATKAIDKLVSSTASRLHFLQEASEIARDHLRHLGLQTAPENDKKVRFIERWRVVGASMRPRHECRGKYCAVETLQERLAASMRPRLSWCAGRAQHSQRCLTLSGEGLAARYAQAVRETCRERNRC
jgi:hypothetical protein